MGDDPFLALAASLKPHLQAQGYDTRKIRQALINTGTISPLLEAIVAQHPAGIELLIFIDQFEELFTQVTPAHSKSFAVLLGQMAETPGLRTVLTLRADFYHHCLDYSPLLKLLRVDSFLLGMPDLLTMMEMITGPALPAGLSFEDGLPKRILVDTGSEPGALALMAFALAELYRACQPHKTLILAAYQSFGGVQGALAQRAEMTFKALPIEGQESGAEQAFNQVFTQLIDIDPSRSTPTRKRVSLAHFSNVPAAQRFIHSFSEARLLVCDEDDTQAAVLEVAHEALLTHWPRLKNWIDARFDDFRLRRQLQHAARDWQSRDKADAYLWSDERVMEACDMLKRINYQPDRLELEFLGPIDPASMLLELQDPVTFVQRRVLIGVRLALTGDPRPGVGLRDEGLPDIAWAAIPAGEVNLADDVGTFPVESFSLACFPVTNAQFQAFLDDPEGYPNPQWWSGLDAAPAEIPKMPSWNEANHPRETVSWFEAMAFCAWLSERLGFEIRLPTEWQWQQAACSGDPVFDYPWG